MDIGSVRPVIPGMNAPVPRAPAAAEQASTTDLPVSSTVTRPSESAAIGNSTSGQTQSQTKAAADPLRSTVVIDDKTKTVVYQQIDDLTGQVVDQVPAEGRLRMRAMIDAWMGAMRSSQTTGTQGNGNYTA